MNHKRNIALLAAAQALLLTNGIMLVAINGLLGLQLAADKRLATLPITTYVIGGALATLPAALFLKRFGRRARFMLPSPPADPPLRQRRRVGAAARRLLHETLRPPRRLHARCRTGHARCGDIRLRR